MTDDHEKGGSSWKFTFPAGVGALALSVFVCNAAGKPEYIRGVGLAIGVIAAVIYVYFNKYGRRLWFWTTIALAAVVHVPVIALLFTRINNLSPLVTIPLGVLDGIIIVVVIVVLSARFETR